MKEQYLSATRTARFAIAGNEIDPKDVWFVCHGYRQLASRFIRYFEILEDDSTLVVAPEGLSRFYIDPDHGPHGPDVAVGASWMTREDRDNEISDYVGYLDTLHDHIFNIVDRGSARFRVLGFSQGAETVARWVDRGAVEPDHLVLWGGLLPKDVDPTRGGSPFGRIKVSVVFGDADDLATPQRLESLESRLASVDYDMIRFEGGHQLNKVVLSQLSKVSV